MCGKAPKEERKLAGTKACSHIITSSLLYWLQRRTMPLEKPQSPERKERGFHMASPGREGLRVASNAETSSK